MRQVFTRNGFHGWTAGCHNCYIDFHGGTAEPDAPCWVCDGAGGEEGFCEDYYAPDADGRCSAIIQMLVLLV